MRRKISFLLPQLFLLTLAILFAGALRAEGDFLNMQPQEPLPAFSVPLLGSAGYTFSNKDLQTGKVSILNVWASWCGYCQEEHPLLMEIKRNYNIPIYGVDFEDSPQAALGYLSQHGNPYLMVGSDMQGTVGNALQVSGTPETFIIDKHGVIRYRRIGTLDRFSWVNVFLPLIKQYEKET